MTCSKGVRYLHQHVAGDLVVVVNVDAEHIEHSHRYADVGAGYNFPGKVVVGRIAKTPGSGSCVRRGVCSHNTVSEIVVDAGVTGGTVAGLEIDPIYILEPVFVHKVPPCAHRPEVGPALVASEE